MTQNTTPSRRKLLTTGLGVLAAPAILRVLPANAQGRTLRIGHVSPRSGPLAALLVQELREAGVEATT